MSKINRVRQYLFGVNMTPSDCGEFGSLAAGSPTTGINPVQVQSLPAWLLGWAKATIGSFRPAYQDMNAVHYLAFYQLCYLLQQGIAEYESNTTYYIGSIVSVGGIIYTSLIDNNTGNTPLTSPSSWNCGVNEILGASLASAGSMSLGNDGNSFKITGTTNISNITIKIAGTIVQLIFTDVLQVQNGGNIVLTNGAFNTANNYLLTLISDGTNWIEVSRAPLPLAIGIPVARSSNTLYQEATGGYVNASALVFSPNNSTPSGFQIQIGPTSALGTVISESYTQSSSTNFVGSGEALIPKGWYYNVVTMGFTSSAGVFFTPLGS